MDQQKSCFKSEPFKFIVGGESFYVHRNVVSHHSKPLHRLINIDMKEKDQDFAVLGEGTSTTFQRFLDWAYTGFYVAPEPGEDRSSKAFQGKVKKPEKNAETIHFFQDAQDEEVLADEEILAVEKSKLDIDDWAFGTKRGKRGKKGISVADFEYPSEPQAASQARLRIRNAFVSQGYTELRTAIPIPPARKNKGGNEDYTDIFLCHAQLYVFAEKWDIQKLKRLALENLHETLKHFTLYVERTGDIVELLRYVYQNTLTIGRSETIEPEPIRALLTDYIGFEMDTLLKDGGFNELMLEDGGALLGDFTRMVMERI